MAEREQPQFIMESYEVLQKAIPEQQGTKVAKFLGVVSSYVNAWRRRPESDEDPNGTGKRSPLDRICDLIDVCFLINPQDCGLIVQHIIGHFRTLLRTHASPLDSHIVIADTVETLLSETKDCVVTLSREGASDEAFRQLVQLRDAAALAVERCQKTISKEEQTNP